MTREQESFGISYNDLQWAETGERLNAESFARYRKSGGMVIAHSIPDEIVRSTVADPTVIIASDGDIKAGKGHPRGVGTFARVLGKYVRDEKLTSLSEGLKKMTLMPAQRLEGIAPMMKYKGRICEGADADITIFDPEQIIDRATYEEPAKYSIGIKYVLVNGTIIVKDGELQETSASTTADRSRRPPDPGAAGRCCGHAKAIYLAAIMKSSGRMSVAEVVARGFEEHLELARRMEALYGGVHVDKLVKALEDLGFTHESDAEWLGIHVTRWRNPRTQHVIEIWEAGDEDAPPFPARVAVKKPKATVTDEDNLFAAHDAAEVIREELTRVSRDFPHMAPTLKRLRVKVTSFKPTPLQTEKDEVQPASQTEQRPQSPQLSEKTRQWMADNPWFQKDPEMTALAYVAHNALRSAGVPVESDEYFEGITARVKKRFPDAFQSAGKA